MLKWAKKYMLLILFWGFIGVFALLDLLIPWREFSEMENRYLARPPVFSTDSIIKNTYTQKYEEYINDQFFLRDGWITLKSIGESALGRIENNGIIYGQDHYLFDKVTHMDLRQLERNIGHIEMFLQNYSDKHITLTLIPNSYAVLGDKLPAGFNAFDQLSVIQEYNDRVRAAGGNVCDIVPALMEHSGEYIYYRTDHHWTTTGAYLAYEAYANSLGVGYKNLSGMNGYEVEDFLGTYYSKAKPFSAVPDSITWYDIGAASVMIDGQEYPGLYNWDMFQRRDKYAAFIYSNNGLTVIESGANLNHRADEVSRVLVIKDSYGNSFVPFLLYSFDEVYAVDMRYLLGIDELLDAVAFDDIYILYNLASFAQDTNVFRINP